MDIMHRIVCMDSSLHSHIHRIHYKNHSDNNTNNKSNNIIEARKWDKEVKSGVYRHLLLYVCVCVRVYVCDLHLQGTFLVDIVVVVLLDHKADFAVIYKYARFALYSTLSASPALSISLFIYRFLITSFTQTRSYTTCETTTPIIK